MKSDDAAIIFKCMKSMYKEEMTFTEFYQAVCSESGVLELKDKLKIHLMTDGNMLSQVKEKEKELRLEIEEKMQSDYQKKVNRIFDLFIVGMVILLVYSFYLWVLKEV